MDPNPINIKVDPEIDLIFEEKEEKLINIPLDDDQIDHSEIIGNDPIVHQQDPPIPLDYPWRRNFRKINIYRLIVLIPFIICDFYFSVSIKDPCDKVFSGFFIASGIIGLLRVNVIIWMLFKHKLILLILLDKIVYNLIIIGWLFSSIYIGVENSKCERSEITQNFTYFFVEISLSIVYRLFVTIIPIVGFLIYECLQKKKKLVIYNYLKKLDFLKFTDGILKDKDGKDIQTVEKEDDKCMICLSDYDDTSQILRLECNHHFDKKCLEVWTKKGQGTCPACRNPIKISK